MENDLNPSSSQLRVMLFGVGSFTQSVLHVLKAHGAEVSAYLTRGSAHYPPSLEGETYLPEVHPNPCSLLREQRIDFVIPMSISWATADWAAELLSMEIPILSPVGEGLKLERDRAFARNLCTRRGIPFPVSYVARNKLEARNILASNRRPFVIKNTLCSPTSPVHTIICETVEDTRSWLEKIDYAEGVFLQEYLGRREAGHIAFVSGGEIYSLVTNQEYKRAFNGDMGIVTSAPLGGLVEKDPGDKYGLAKQLLHPLLPWFREVSYRGPVQVTAILHNGAWHVIEYNVRLGVTAGPMILRLLENPLEVLFGVVHDEKIAPRFKKLKNFGCSLTLAGYGYPYPAVRGPALPVQILEELDCDVWWNEVETDNKGDLRMTGQRIADIAALDATLPGAIAKAYENIRKIRCVGSYYRTDIGQTLWPPGVE